jgi:hypothetical protein
MDYTRIAANLLPRLVSDEVDVEHVEVRMAG